MVSCIIYIQNGIKRDLFSSLCPLENRNLDFPALKLFKNEINATYDQLLSLAKKVLSVSRNSPCCNTCKTMAKKSLPPESPPVPPLLLTAK